MNSTGIEIRKLTHLDWDDISRIYKEGLNTGIASFETGVPSWSSWDKAHDDQCRLVVCLNGQIVAYSALRKVSSRPQFSGVAEMRIYVSAAYRGVGIGTKLLNQTIKISESLGYWTLQVSIFKENTPAINLHKKVGFKEVGICEKIANRNGKWFDVVFLERRSLVIG